jgi:hypothetical protein
MAAARAALLTALGLRAGKNSSYCYVGSGCPTVDTFDEPEAGSWGASRRQRGRGKRKLDRGKPSETMAAVRAAQLT